MRLPLEARKYVVAIAAVTLAILLRLFVDQWLEDRQPFATLYAAIALCVWYGGYRPAVIAAVLGYLASDYLFTHPRGAIALATTEQVIDVAVYVLSCGIIIGFAQGMRNARKHALRNAQKLAALNEQMRVILDNAPVAIWMAYDVQGEHVEANSFAAKLIGQQTPSRAEFPPLRIGTTDPPVAIGTLLRRVIDDGGQIHSVELELPRQDGRKLSLLASAAPLRNPDGSIRGAVATCVDIADRKRAEEALKLADRRKDEFLATIAHELRNPLAPIRTAVSLLRRMELSDPELRDIRDIIDRQVSQMARLLEDLLDVSRITAGKTILRKELVNLGVVVGTALESSRPLFNSKGQTLTVSLPTDPIFVEGDPTRLAQVFTNLLNNAAKYTHPGGAIEVRGEHQDGSAVIRVIDNGIGIRPESLRDVFGMFVQVDDSADRMQGGLGIGLCVVKRLIELHRGTIEAQSGGLGKGTEFAVHLPACAAPAASTLAAGNVLARTGSARLNVLIADDNTDSARLLGRILTLSGHAIQTAGDGLEALETARTFCPDVALLDLGMPGCNGYEVARRIRADRGDSVLLLAMTGRCQDEDKRLATKAGFDHFLTKPTEPEVVEKLLLDFSRAGHQASASRTFRI